MFRWDHEAVLSLGFDLSYHAILRLLLRFNHRLARTFTQVWWSSVHRIYLLYVLCSFAAECFLSGVIPGVVNFGRSLAVHVIHWWAFWIVSGGDVTFHKPGGGVTFQNAPDKWSHNGHRIISLQKFTWDCVHPLQQLFRMWMFCWSVRENYQYLAYQFKNKGSFTFTRWTFLCLLFENHGRSLMILSCNFWSLFCGEIKLTPVSSHWLSGEILQACPHRHTVRTLEPWSRHSQAVLGNGVAGRSLFSCVLFLVRVQRAQMTSNHDSIPCHFFHRSM